jgi:hypothetical protein
LPSALFGNTVGASFAHSWRISSAQNLSVLPSRRQTLLHRHLPFPGVAVHQEQRVHTQDHLDGRGIVAVHLHGVNEFTPGMAQQPTCTSFGPPMLS